MDDYMCEEYESILKEWYKVINRELFDGCLKPIRIVVEPEFFFFNTGAFGQYCIPDEGEPFLRFNLQGLIDMRTEWIEGMLSDYIEPSFEEVEEEVKEIIAGSLIHEMIHQYSRENDIKDAEVIDGIDIHYDVFKQIAEEKGLLVLPAFNGDSNTHIRPNHPVLDKLQFEDFIEPYYPIEFIVDEWSKWNDAD